MLGRVGDQFSEPGLGARLVALNRNAVDAELLANNPPRLRAHRPHPGRQDHPVELAKLIEQPRHRPNGPDTTENGRGPVRRNSIVGSPQQGPHSDIAHTRAAQQGLHGLPADLPPAPELGRTRGAQTARQPRVRNRDPADIIEAGHQFPDRCIRTHDHLLPPGARRKIGHAPILRQDQHQLCPHLWAGHKQATAWVLDSPAAVSISSRSAFTAQIAHRLPVAVIGVHM